MKIDLPDDYNLRSAERTLLELALTRTGSIVEAARLLGITRHALIRRIVKYGIRWASPATRSFGGSSSTGSAGSGPA